MVSVLDPSGLGVAQQRDMKAPSQVPRPKKLKYTLSLQGNLVFLDINTWYNVQSAANNSKGHWKDWSIFNKK